MEISHWSINCQTLQKRTLPRRPTQTYVSRHKSPTKEGAYGADCVCIVYRYTLALT